MFSNIQLLPLLLLASPMVMGQQPGSNEVHPPLPYQHCAKGGACTPVHGELVMDANWRWVHDGNQKNCFNGNQPNPAVCTDEASCAKACVVEGVANMSTYGVSVNGSAVRLNLFTGDSVGSRFYLLANDSTYAMFKLLGQEFTFDVEGSTLICGVNAALYLVSMDHDGGSAKHPNNKAGAKFGTGYCDAQCPKGDRWMGGNGKLGACCSEMDLWEANSEATAFTPHPCNPLSSLCSGDACANTCDSPGCGFNSYGMGNHTFYGPGKTVDSKKVITVVTQFITSDGTASGDLTEIRRFYVQGGKVIPNSMSTIAGMSGNALTHDFCAKGPASFTQRGGLKQMGEALREGMVLTFSLWDDQGGHMLWLDSGNNGPCSATSGAPADIKKQTPNAYVVFSNMKVGPINSTFTHA